MRMAYNDLDDRAGLRGYVQFNKYIHTHTHTSAAILFCFTAGILLPRASPSLQAGGGACEHPTAPFERPGVCTSASRGSTFGEGRDTTNSSPGGSPKQPLPGIRMHDPLHGRQACPEFIAFDQGNGIGVGGGNGDGNGDVNGHGDGDGAGTGTGAEVNEGAQYGNGDGNGDGAGTGTGTGVGTRRQIPDGNGDDDNGNENRIGEGGREAKKRKKPQNCCRRRAGNGGDTGGNKTKCRKERIGSVVANPNYIGSNKEAGGEAQGAQGSSKICTSRESVSPLSRLIKGFRNKYH